MTGAPEWIQERLMGQTDPQHAVSRGYGDPDQMAVLAPILNKIDPLDIRRLVQI